MRDTFGREGIKGGLDQGINLSTLDRLTNRVIQ